METAENRNGQHPKPAEESAGEYRRVRELLLGGEQRQLNFLHHQLQEIQRIQIQLDQRCQTLHANEVNLAQQFEHLIQRGDEFVDRNLVAAIQRRIAGNQSSREELVRALKAPVEESLRQDPDHLRDLLEPAVAPQINRTLAEVFKESGLLKLVRFRDDGSAKLAWPAALATSALLIGLTGWLVYSIKENLALQQADAALRTEPGIVVTVAENPPLEKPRIAGLRDPLAPDPAEILREAGLRPENFSIDLQPFQSVGTTYAHQREQDRVRELEDARKSMTQEIGELTAASENVRQQDLETFTRALFALKFPEAADNVTLTYANDRWSLSGAVADPLYTRLRERSAELVLDGEVDTSGLKNATLLQFEDLRRDIEIAQLVFHSGNAELTEDGVDHSEQLIDLIGELDATSETLGRDPVHFLIHSLPVIGESEINETVEKERIEVVRERLIKRGKILADRILPGVPDTEALPGRAGVYIEVVEPEN